MSACRILIVEDDLVIAAHISLVIETAGYKVAEILTKGESALTYVTSNDVDVILMDVELAGELNGIETAIRINQSKPIPIIFLTANVDEVTFRDSKKAFPKGFIAKPFKNEDLTRTLELVLNNSDFSISDDELEMEESVLKDRIFVRDKNKMVRLNIDDILYVEAERNYCKITTKSKPYTLSIPLLKFEQKVSSDQFMRIHRSHVVNISAIDELDEHYVFVDGKSLAVSKSYKQALTKKLTML